MSCVSVKNHTDVLIFQTAICSGASQIALMADEKSPSRVSRRPVAQSAPEWRLICHFAAIRLVANAQNAPAGKCLQARSLFT